MSHTYKLGMTLVDVLQGVTDEEHDLASDTAISLLAGIGCSPDSYMVEQYQTAIMIGFVLGLRNGLHTGTSDDAQVVESPKSLHSFEVVEVPKISVAGDKLYTVIHTFDGVVMGGDHHWVRKRYAERLLKLYEAKPHLHGKPESDLRVEWSLTFPELKLFDTDVEYEAATADNAKPEGNERPSGAELLDAYNNYVEACDAENLEHHGYDLWIVHGKPSGPI